MSMLRNQLALARSLQLVYEGTASRHPDRSNDAMFGPPPGCRPSLLSENDDGDGRLLPLPRFPLVKLVLLSLLVNAVYWLTLSQYKYTSPHSQVAHQVTRRDRTYISVWLNVCMQGDQAMPVASSGSRITAVASAQSRQQDVAERRKRIEQSLAELHEHMQQQTARLEEERQREEAARAQQALQATRLVLEQAAARVEAATVARARAEAEIKMKIVLAEEEAWMAVRAQREREDARRAREEVEAELAPEQEEKQREFSASVNLVRAELGNPLLAAEDCAKTMLEECMEHEKRHEEEQRTKVADLDKISQGLDTALALQAKKEQDRRETLQRVQSLRDLAQQFVQRFARKGATQGAKSAKLHHQLAKAASFSPGHVKRIE